MCGRVRISSRKPEDFEEFRELQIDPDLNWLERYNLFPSEDFPVVRQAADGLRSLSLVKWGLMRSWMDSPAKALSLARADTVSQKPSFSEPYRHRRCIVPVDGYYEWERLSPTDKQPWYVAPNAGGFLSLAGIWSTWTDSETRRSMDTCAIITTAPGPELAQIHDRTPVVLPPESYDTWLNPSISDVALLNSLLQPSPEGSLKFNPVSTYVNNPKHEGPKCVEPIRRPRGLFD